MRTLAPRGIHAPLGDNYSHGVVLDGHSRLLFIAGQVGVDPDGVVVTDTQAHFDQAWLNVVATLDDAGMTVSDIVKVSVFLADERFRENHRVSCSRFLRSHRPAMTAVVVRQLWTSDLLVEVDVIAAAHTPIL